VTVLLNFIGLEKKMKKTCENKAERGGTRRRWTFSTFLHRIWTLFCTPL